MKRNDLIKMLNKLPEDAEIMILFCDDMMGYYTYNELVIEEVTAFKQKDGSLVADICNSKREDDIPTKIYSIGN